MLKELNTKLENLGEQLRGSISYDFDFDFCPYSFLVLKFKKERLLTKNINKNLYKKLK